MEEKNLEEEFKELLKTYNEAKEKLKVRLESYTIYDLEDNLSYELLNEVKAAVDDSISIAWQGSNCW